MNLRDSLNLRDFNTDRNLPRGKSEPEERKKPRLTKQRRERMSDDQTYNQVAAIYKAEHPYCMFCGEESANLATDHICRGVAGRASSLLDFDTWINQCPQCHEKSQAVEVKVLAKLRNVIVAVERHRDRKLSSEQCAAILDGIKTLLS